MRADVRAELDRIEQFLMRGDRASADLAAILSGLRGPDTRMASYSQKIVSTIPIRRQAFPRIAALADTYETKLENLLGQTFRATDAPERVDDAKLTQMCADYHFLAHAKVAQHAIDAKDE